MVSLSSDGGIGCCLEEFEVPNLAGRDFPDHSQRALQGETQDRLTVSTSSEPVDPAALLERIRLQREAIGHIDLDDKAIRELRDAGRP